MVLVDTPTNLSFCSPTCRCLIRARVGALLCHNTFASPCAAPGDSGDVVGLHHEVPHCHSDMWRHAMGTTTNLATRCSPLQLRLRVQARSRRSRPPRPRRSTALRGAIATAHERADLAERLGDERVFTRCVAPSRAAAQMPLRAIFHRARSRERGAHAEQERSSRSPSRSAAGSLIALRPRLLTVGRAGAARTLGHHEGLGASVASRRRVLLADWSSGRDRSPRCEAPLSAARREHALAGSSRATIPSLEIVARPATRHRAPLPLRNVRADSRRLSPSPSRSAPGSPRGRRPARRGDRHRSRRAASRSSARPPRASRSRLEALREAAPARRAACPRPAEFTPIRTRRDARRRPGADRVRLGLAAARASSSARPSRRPSGRGEHELREDRVRCRGPRDPARALHDGRGAVAVRRHRRHGRAAAHPRAGPQAPASRRPRTEHRRHGRLRAGLARHARARRRGAPHDPRADAGRAARRRTPLPRAALRGTHADAHGPVVESLPFRRPERSVLPLMRVAPQLVRIVATGVRSPTRHAAGTKRTR